MNSKYQKQNLLDIYRGAMAEQFVGQEMMLPQEGSIHYMSHRGVFTVIPAQAGIQAYS